MLGKGGGGRGGGGDGEHQAPKCRLHAQSWVMAGSWGQKQVRSGVERSRLCGVSCSKFL